MFENGFGVLYQFGLLLWLLVELIYECLLYCFYCLNLVNLGFREQECDIDIWLKVFSDVCEMGVVQLGFFGGELFLCKDLE